MTKAIILVAVSFVACAGGAPQKAAEQPSAIASPSPPSAPTASAQTTPAKTCLMVNVCQCNLGCASIDVPASKLRPGLVTTVVSGALQNEKVRVVEVVDKSGAKVLALTDLDHDHACSLSRAPELIGYGCDAENGGTVPAKACVNGCD